MLMWITYSMHRWYPTENLVLGHGHGGKGLPDLRLEELRFPSGAPLQDGDCFQLFSAMD